MNTRHAKPGSPFHPERYASSLEPGLPANLVAKRCSALDPQIGREGIWFVQWLSHQRGGLKAFADSLWQSGRLKSWRDSYWEGRRKPDPRFTPSELLGDLRSMCLDPDSHIAFFYHGEIEEYREGWIRERPEIAKTSVTKPVETALNYTRKTRSLVLVTGPAHTGRTFAARAWCDRTAGMARMVRVPPTNDDRTFYNEIAAALGLSCSRAYSMNEIRDRIEDTLACGDLMLVFYDASFLFPRTRWAARPDRVNWILSNLVNQGVPVALIGGSDFFAAQKRVEEFGWDASEFANAIAHYQELPTRLANADLLAIAKMRLPAMEDKTIAALVAYADISHKNLACVEAVVKRAECLAADDGREELTANDIKRAMKYHQIPSDDALEKARAGTRNNPRRASAPAQRQPRGEIAAATRFGDLTNSRQVSPTAPLVGCAGG